MKGLIRSVSSVILLASFTVLPACVQPHVQPQRTSNGSAVRDIDAGEAATAERVVELAQQLESMTRYASRMEQIYAAQEAEILALREKVASLARRQSGSE